MCNEKICFKHMGKSKSQIRCRSNRLISVSLSLSQSGSLLGFRKYKPLATIYGCTAWFVTYLVGNPQRHFSLVRVLYNKTRSLTLYLSHVMRKPTFCICENKDADQLRGDREADQRLCFRYIDSTIPLLSKSEISSL